MALDISRNRWRTRRRMAWIAMWYLILEVPIFGILLATGVDISNLVPLAISVGTAMVAIIMLYIGFATQDDIKNNGS